MSRKDLVTKYLNEAIDSLLKGDDLTTRDFNLAMICAALQAIGLTLAQIADMMEAGLHGGTE